MTQHPPAAAVDVRSLHVRFGDVEAVAGVDLAAYAGRATGLLGRNGAGKSTTMRVLAGVVPPTAGTALVAGHDVRHDPIAVKRATGYCPDVGGLVPRATAVGAPAARPPGSAGWSAGRSGAVTCSSGSVSVTPPTG